MPRFFGMLWAADHIDGFTNLYTMQMYPIFLFMTCTVLAKKVLPRWPAKKKSIQLSLAVPLGSGCVFPAKQLSDPLNYMLDQQRTSWKKKTAINSLKPRNPWVTWIYLSALWMAALSICVRCGCTRARWRGYGEPAGMWKQDVTYNFHLCCHHGPVQSILCQAEGLEAGRWCTQEPVVLSRYVLRTELEGSWRSSSRIDSSFWPKAAFTALLWAWKYCRAWDYQAAGLVHCRNRIEQGQLLGWRWKRVGCHGDEDRNGRRMWWNQVCMRLQGMEPNSSLKFWNPLPVQITWDTGGSTNPQEIPESGGLFCTSTLQRSHVPTLCISKYELWSRVVNPSLLQMAGNKLLILLWVQE